MGYIVTIILLFVTGIEYKEKKTWTAPSVVFCSFWTVISLAASFRLFNLNSVEMKTWCVILVGVISFTVGTKIKIKFRNSTLIEINKSVQNSCISVKTFWILFIITGMDLAGKVYQTFNLLNNKIPLYLIRAASFGLVKLDGYNSAHGFLAALINIIITAIETFLIAVGIEYFFKDPRKKWPYVLASFCLVLGKAFYAGGRWILVYFIIEFFTCKNILSHQGFTKKITILSKVKRRGMILSSLFIFVTIFMFFQISSGRDIKNMSRHLYNYLCGCVPFLDLKIHEIDQKGIYSFIYASFYGLWYYILLAIQKVTGTSFLLQSEILNTVMSGQEERNIGSGMFNAFTTAFYYLYADFRFLGVFLGMFLFGVISGNLFRIAQSRHNSYALVAYLIVSQMLISSIQVYPFTSAENVFSFVIILVIYILSRCKFETRYSQINRR